MTHLAAIPSKRREHLVQFYENSHYLIDGVGRYIGEGLSAGEAGVVIATPPHRGSLEKALTERGLDLREARQDGRFVSLDAGETLSRFWDGGSFQKSLLQEVIGSALSRASQAGRVRRVRVYGEMVALLWSRGDREAAVELERLWNDLGNRHDFSLLCAYPIKDFSGQTHEKDFQEVCAAHTAVIPSESYSAAETAEKRARVIAALQQKAESLEIEVARRQKAEADLMKKIDQLAEADRRKDEFLAMLGHELRNPLSPIVMSLRLLKMRLGDPDVLARSVDLIERQTQRLIRLVDDLLDVSRITRGTIELKEDTVGLTSLVERAIEQARPVLEERGHQLSLRLPEEPVYLRADPNRMEQALANLLINAAKYTDMGGRIEVSAAREGPEVKISIRDNGMGLAPELREQIFDLFVQSPNSASRIPGGFGLGLTVVRRLIQLHGGTVEAFSDGPGKGSEFVVRLPIRPAGPPADGTTSAQVF
jgi:signal transduction histidine kinase